MDDVANTPEFYNENAHFANVNSAEIGFRVQSIQNFRRGMSFWIANDGNASTIRPHYSALGDGFLGVIRALGMNIRSDRQQKTLNGWFVKDGDQVDCSQ